MTQTQVYTTPKCVVCDKATELIVDSDQLAAWKNGEMVQYAFPDFSPSKRELLITGTHPECWDVLIQQL